MIDYDAITIAAHLTMILAIGVFVVRLVGSQVDGAYAAAIGKRDLFGGIAFALGLLAIERLYYVAARALRDRGIDLWGAHPAPELLSLLVAIGLYAATSPIVAARAGSWVRAARRLAAEVAALAAIFGAVVWALH
jgi:hypothetical protein